MKNVCLLLLPSHLPVSHFRFMKPAPMFLDRNFKRLAKVSNNLPPFGFKTQGKKRSISSLTCRYCHLLYVSWIICWIVPMCVWSGEINVDDMRELDSSSRVQHFISRVKNCLICMFLIIMMIYSFARLLLLYLVQKRCWRHSHTVLFYLWHQWCNLLNWSTNYQNLS